MGFEMGKDHGRKELAVAIDTMETIETIKNGATESSPGKVEMFIKETMKQT